MAGTRSSIAHSFKKAFRDAAVALWATSEPEVAVHFGRPGTFLAADIVSFGNLSSDQVPAAMGTNRSREEMLELEVTISCFVGGDDTAEEEASDRAYYLLGQLEDLVRTADTTLDGVVRECFLVRHESEGSTDPRVLAAGRNIAITATFQAKFRITGS